MASSSSRSSLGSKDDAVHLAACKEQSCRRCAFLWNADEWYAKTQICVQPVSYLRCETTTAGKWQVFCWICRKAHGSSGKGLAAGIEPSHLNNVTRHAHFKCHQEALFDLGLPHVAPDLEAPSAASFLKVSEHCQKASAWSHGVGSVGGRRKITSMMTCLAQAIFRADQCFLKTAMSIMLHCDVRRNRLAIRFRAANMALEARVGLLGVSRIASHSSVHIRDGFIEALKLFCTRAGAIDEELLYHILRKVEILDGDAAADGQLAMSMLRSSGFFPAIKCIVKDPCHASRRVIKRPWSVIEEIKEPFFKVIEGKGSLTNIIQNSDTLTQIFSDFVDRCLDCPVLGKQTRNLSRRAHRFDSYQKPLARFCLFAAAFFETATWISVHKKSDLKPFTAATDFLTWVTAEKLLLLAMCADGADESLMLTRHFDSESHDIAEIHAAAGSYVTRLKFLFVQEQAVRTTGFTSHMLQWLQKTRAFKVGKKVKCIGGPGIVTRQMIELAFKPIKVFVHLAAQTIEAEYPSFSIIAAFACFDVQPSTTELDMAAQEKHLRRLSQVLNAERGLRTVAVPIWGPSSHCHSLSFQQKADKCCSMV